jgi:hypothetical protein
MSCVKKLMAKAHNRAMAERYGHCNRYSSKGFNGGEETGVLTPRAKRVEPRAPEARKPVGFKRQCRTRWDKIAAKGGF